MFFKPWGQAWIGQPLGLFIVGGSLQIVIHLILTWVPPQFINLGVYQPRVDIMAIFIIYGYKKLAELWAVQNFFLVQLYLLDPPASWGHG